jgi:hypothetical protein
MNAGMTGKRTTYNMGDLARASGALEVVLVSVQLVGASMAVCNFTTGRFAKVALPSGRRLYLSAVAFVHVEEISHKVNHAEDKSERHTVVGD